MDFFAEAKGHAHAAHLVLEGFGDFGVEESEAFMAAFDEGDLNAEGGEHAGVFDADDPPTDDDHGPGDVIELEELIGSDDGFVVEGDGIGPRGGCRWR